MPNSWYFELDVRVVTVVPIVIVVVASYFSVKLVPGATNEPSCRITLPCSCVALVSCIEGSVVVLYDLDLSGLLA